ncbi:MAG: hypothetical protein WCC22_02590 [Terriglobales bacterium]
MKRTTSILTCLMVAGLAWAQSPQIIQNTRTKMQTVENNATAASNQALGDKASSKPAAGVHNTAAKTGASPFKTGSTTPAPPKPAPVQKPAPVSTKSTGAVAVKPAAGAKPAKVAVEPKKAASAPKNSAPAAASSSEPSAAGAGQEAKKEDQDSPDKRMTGKRDPFVSPVVSHMGGSGCSTGKKCLEIGAINLRGVVRSEAGFIAVVTNSLNKAYFLRENDPVFDGYVVKITDDSVTFKEMLQDRLGKTLTREVVKKITAPAV